MNTESVKIGHTKYMIREAICIDMLHFFRAGWEDICSRVLYIGIVKNPVGLPDIL